MTIECSRSAGVHLSSDGRVRVVRMERAKDGDGWRVLGAVDTPHALPAVEVIGDPRNLVAHLTDAARSTLQDTSESTAVCFVLGGSWIQLRRVPLEVAAADARRSQIRWEAGLALLPAREDYRIDSIHAHRSGAWLAVRNSVLEGLDRLADELGFIRSESISLPVALAAAANTVRRRSGIQGEAAAVVHLTADRAWLLSLLAESTGDARYEIRGIETVPQSRHGVASGDAVDGALRWLRGDRTRAGGRPADETVYVSGHGACIERLLRGLPRATVHTLDLMSDHGAPEPPQDPPAFAPAAAAAWRCLNGDTL